MYRIYSALIEIVAGVCQVKCVSFFIFEFVK